MELLRSLMSEIFTDLW